MRISSRITTRTTGNPKSKYSFTKGERLTSRKSISSLFESGRQVEIFPLRVVYRTVEEGNFPLTMAISVPKRLFRKAVDRNLLKRRIREAYRLNKPEFYSGLSAAGRSAEVVIQYRDRKIASFNTIEQSLLEAMRKVIGRIGQGVNE